MASDQSGRGDLIDWLFSKTGIATAAAVAVLGFLIYTGHSAHLLGALPWLLILACPLLHIFMHGSHGSDHRHRDGKEPRSDKQDADEPPHQHQH
jgi:hypothetical protein